MVKDNTQRNTMLVDIDCALILKNAPDLYLIIDPCLNIIEANDAFLKATMVKHENIIGHKIFEVFPDNPDDPNSSGKRKLKRAIQRVLITKKSYKMKVIKYDIRRPLCEGGEFEERFWQTLITPVLDEHNNVKYLFHRIEDITELQHLKNLKAESAQRLQLLIENIKDYGIIMLDEKEHIIAWNPGAEHIIGYKEVEVISQPISMVFPDHCYEYGFKIARTQGRYEAEGWRKRKNGTRFWANIVVTPIFGIKHQLLGYSKVISDLTVRKEIETAKDEFISVVNHELRTPLTSILGALKILLHGHVKSQNKAQKLLQTANANGERLLKLITDILDVEKLSIGGLSLQIQEVDLNQLVINTIDMNSIYSNEYGVNLTYTLLSTDLKVNIDPNRLIQVLTNLISNAIKFSIPGGEVNVSLIKKKNTVRVAVTNTGKGISEQFRSKIFEKFTQADVSTTRAKSGTGLGLAISQAIMEQFGSIIKFKSVPDKETTFYFDLPLI